MQLCNSSRKQCLPSLVHWHLNSSQQAAYSAALCRIPLVKLQHLARLSNQRHSHQHQCLGRLSHLFLVKLQVSLQLILSLFTEGVKAISHFPELVWPRPPPSGHRCCLLFLEVGSIWLEHGIPGMSPLPVPFRSQVAWFQSFDEIWCLQHAGMVTSYLLRTCFALVSLRFEDEVIMYHILLLWCWLFRSASDGLPVWADSITVWANAHIWTNTSDSSVWPDTTTSTEFSVWRATTTNFNLWAATGFTGAFCSTAAFCASVSTIWNSSTAEPFFQ